MGRRWQSLAVCMLWLLGMLLPASLVAQRIASSRVDLPTSKQLYLPAPGDPRRVNSLPISLALSPDGHWLASLNGGYGTAESNYMQSIAVMNTGTGEMRDFPDARTLVESKQTFFSGLTFSPDGTHLYASLASASDPSGDGKKKTGSGIVVYSFAAGVLVPERFFKLPMVPLAPGRHTDLRSSSGEAGAIPYPAAIAWAAAGCGADCANGGHDTLLIAENLSDTVAMLDAQTGQLLRRFDLSEDENVPTTYPVALAVTSDGKRAFVALWNASEIAEIDLVHGTVVRHLALLKPSSVIAPGTHPCALLLDERAGMLYAALSNRDAVAAVSIGKPRSPELAVRRYFDTRLPGQSYFGAEPDALAENADGSRLYAANLGSDAVAVLDTHRLRSMARAKGMAEPLGFVPTELMPLGLASRSGNLYIASGKGKGTGPNNHPQPVTESVRGMPRFQRDFSYAPTLLYGSLASLNEAGIESNLAASTEAVLASNRMRSAAETIRFENGSGKIKHVIYIIKENRSYDQLFGDLSVDGHAIGNGDPSLTMYGAAVTPNQHKLALQFGVLDNFFDSGEVSGDGHVWSTAAIGTDYLERTWQANYRGGQHTYDYEGVVANGYPLLQHVPDVVEPASGYLWSNFAAHGKSIYHFGEYVSSIFCADRKTSRQKPADPRQGAMSGAQSACTSPFIRPGEALPAEWGGGVNLWPWPIPRLANNIATKPELVGHFAPESPDFNLRVPDQIRVNVFLRHLEQWKRDRGAGHDTMPEYVLLRLPDDHTEGTRPGGPTPKASIADNDLAIGRAVEAISHSAYWDDTAFFILEDDAQNGADHVDAHRSLGIVVSKYAPHPQPGQGAFVDSRFYSTVSMLRTMETLLGVPPMNNNDAFSSLISTLFTGPGDQPSFNADTSNRHNGLIYTANTPAAPGAAESMKMDFSHADRADSSRLNLILWQDAMGSEPPPKMLLVKHPHKKDDDD